MTKEEALFEYLQRIGDDRLIHGHRISEWSGHGPGLEEDIALANIALDCIGQASSLLEYAGQVENKGRDQDKLAYFRDALEYRNINLVELPKGDFGFTIARLFLFSSFAYLHLSKLVNSADETLAGQAAKALKETRYHLRHSREWVLRLGDGTDESHDRIQKSFNELWAYTTELFYMDQVDAVLIEEKIAPDLESFREEWTKLVNETLEEATLTVPNLPAFSINQGRKGGHTEHLGYILGEMQILPRTYPDATW